MVSPKVLIATLIETGHPPPTFGVAAMPLYRSARPGHRRIRGIEYGGLPVLPPA
jgi:hypothetical protein